MKTYQITEELLNEILNVLAPYWFSDNGEYNNDDVIKLDAKIRALKNEKTDTKWTADEMIKRG